MTPLAEQDLTLLDAYWRAANYLSVGQIYLMDNPLLREPLRPEHVKPRLLGHWGTSPGLNLIYAHLNRVIRLWDLDAMFVTGPGHGGPALVANAYLEGTYSEVYPEVEPRRGRPAPPLPAVLVPGRHPQPRGARDARLDQRGRRARLLARARLRGGVRQPRPARRLRGRRRRGRDRPARGELALEQVPRPGARRRGAADPAPERLQDRQPDGALAHPGGRARDAVRGSRLPRPLRRRRRADGRAPPVRDGARRGRARDRRDPEQGPQRTGGRRAPRGPDGVRRALADDRPAHAQGLDRPQGGRRPAGGGHLPLPPGAPDRRAQQARPARAARGVAAELPAGRAVRRGRRARARAAGAGAEGPPAHERQRAHQRRRPAARPLAAGLPRLRGRRAAAGAHAQRSHPRAGRVPPGHHPAEPGELPPVRPRRDDVEQAGRGLRGHGPRLRRHHRPRRRGPLARGTRHGGPLRAPLPGLARGLPAHRPPRHLRLLRGVHPHRRLDVQPACEVAEGVA